MAASDRTQPQVVDLNRKVRNGREFQGALRRLERDGPALATMQSDLTDPVTVQGVGDAVAVLRAYGGASLGAVVQAARPDTERLGFPVVLVRADRNRLERTSLGDFLDRQTRGLAHPVGM